MPHLPSAGGAIEFADDNNLGLGFASFHIYIVVMAENI